MSRRPRPNPQPTVLRRWDRDSEVHLYYTGTVVSTWSFDRDKAAIFPSETAADSARTRLFSGTDIFFEITLEHLR